MGIAWVEAVRLGRVNRSQQEELEDRHAALLKRAERDLLAQEQRRQEVYDHVLIPFRDVFARLKNVDLAELASIDLPAAGHTPQVDRCFQQQRRGPASLCLAAVAQRI